MLHTKVGHPTGIIIYFRGTYLPAPRNIEATPIQDAAYLTWDYPFVGSKLVPTLHPVAVPNSTYEYSPLVANQQIINATEAIWDVFTFQREARPHPPRRRNRRNHLYFSSGMEPTLVKNSKT